MSIDPLRITHQVIRNVGVDDCNVLATNGGSILRSQLGNDLLNDLNSQLAGVVQTSTRGNLGLSAISSHLGAVGNIGAGLQHIADDGVQSHTGLSAQQLGCFQDSVIQGSQLQNIRLGDVVTVLSNGCSDDADAQALAIRGHTFSQGSSCLCQRCKLTEFNSLTAVSRDGSLLTELIMNQVCLSFIDQSHVVEGLHFSGQTRQQGGLQLISEQLQVEHHDTKQAHEQVDNLLHFLISFHVRGDQMRFRNESSLLAELCG